MEKPKEDIRIVKALISDLREYMKQIEKEINARLDWTHDKIMELEKQNEQPKINQETKNNL